MVRELYLDCCLFGLPCPDVLAINGQVPSNIMVVSLADDVTMLLEHLLGHENDFLVDFGHDSLHLTSSKKPSESSHRVESSVYVAKYSRDSSPRSMVEGLGSGIWG